VVVYSAAAMSALRSSESSSTQLHVPIEMKDFE